MAESMAQNINIKNDRQIKQDLKTGWGGGVRNPDEKKPVIFVCALIVSESTDWCLIGVKQPFI